MKSLLQARADFNILAVTRNPGSPAAQKLKDLSPNISLVPGDLSDAPAIFINSKKATIGPIWVAYYVQRTITPRQRVYSSVDRGGGKGSFENPTTVPHFAGKIQCGAVPAREDVWRPHGLDHAPTGRLHGQLHPGSMAKVFFTASKVALDKNRPLQLIACADIGHFAAQALMNPDKYKGRAISLAGDEFTFDQAAAVFKQKIGGGIPTTYGVVDSLTLMALKDIGTMFKWMSSEGLRLILRN